MATVDAVVRKGNRVTASYPDKQSMSKDVKNVSAVSSKAAGKSRKTPGRAETLELIKTLAADADFATSLAVQLLYGCGLRVTELLNLRVKDVNLETMQLTIRSARTIKDRVVPIPCSVLEELKEQLGSARAIWKRDQQLGIPVVLPDSLALRYPHSQFDWNWSWVFPANEASLNARTRKMVRDRLHEGKVQRAIRKAAQKNDIHILPSDLRHAAAQQGVDGKTDFKKSEISQRLLEISAN